MSSEWLSWRRSGPPRSTGPAHDRVSRRSSVLRVATLPTTTYKPSCSAPRLSVHPLLLGKQDIKLLFTDFLSWPPECGEVRPGAKPHVLRATKIARDQTSSTLTETKPWVLRTSRNRWFWISFTARSIQTEVEKAKKSRGFLIGERLWYNVQGIQDTNLGIASGRGQTFCETKWPGERWQSEKSIFSFSSFALPPFQLRLGGPVQLGKKN